MTVTSTECVRVDGPEVPPAHAPDFLEKPRGPSCLPTSSAAVIEWGFRKPVEQRGFGLLTLSDGGQYPPNVRSWSVGYWFVTK